MCDDVVDKRKMTLDPSFTGGVTGTLDIFLYFNKLNHEKFVFNILDEKIASVPIVFYLRKNSYFTEVVNEKLRNFASSGLITKWINDSLQPQFSKKLKRKQKQQILSVKKLSGAFMLTIVGWLLAFFVFLIEIWWIKVRRNKKSV
jgi:hypothetical protein